MEIDLDGFDIANRFAEMPRIPRNGRWEGLMICFLFVCSVESEFMQRSEDKQAFAKDL